jgi:hypothetical protein
MTPASRSGRDPFFSALAVVLLLVAPPLRSESLDNLAALKPGSRLAAYFFGRDQIQDLYAIGRRWDSKLGLKDCNGAYNVQPINLYLLKPIDLPEGKAHPASGAWQHRYAFERCGKRTIYNAIFVARTGEKPEPRPHVPGTTNASPLLIADTLKGAYPAALSRLGRTQRAKDCREVDLIDTRLTQPPRNRVADNPASPWEEVWTFRGCGHEVEIPVTFMPDGKGGTVYSIKGG